MTEEVQVLSQVRDSVDALGTKIDHLDTSVRWSRIREFVLIGVVAAVCAALFLGAWAILSVRSENRCIAGLAAASADRIGALAPLSKTRQDAADARADASANLLFQALQLPPDMTPAQRAGQIAPAVAAFKAAEVNYQDANSDYEKAYAANPPPSVPDFHC